MTKRQKMRNQFTYLTRFLLLSLYTASPVRIRILAESHGHQQEHDQLVRPHPLYRSHDHSQPPPPTQPQVTPPASHPSPQTLNPPDIDPRPRSDDSRAHHIPLPPARSHAPVPPLFALGHIDLGAPETELRRAESQPTDGQRKRGRAGRDPRGDDNGRGRYD